MKDWHCNSHTKLDKVLEGSAYPKKLLHSSSETSETCCSIQYTWLKSTAIEHITIPLTAKVVSSRAGEWW